MDKIDFIARDKQLYAPKNEPEVVDVPVMWYLMFDGQGTPESNPEFQKAFQALYGVAYSLKFMPKKGVAPEGWQDFKVPPPEGLWWMADGSEFDSAKPEDWRWTLMVRVPDWVTPKLARQAAAELVAKKKDDVYVNVRLEGLAEGKSVQLMHTGPYETEGPDLAKMDSFAATGGLRYHGKHHEIYFGDPRRTKPEKLKTILRHPVVHA
jgi:hypothetical protein